MIPNNSFNFGGKNSLVDWNIKIIAHDFLMPTKRPRKVVIPNRDGSYDYGAKYYDERILRIQCEWEKKPNEIPRHIIREIAFGLSEKEHITLWNEPDKYYIGELYDPAEITDYPQEHFKSFELNFVCEPFAYKRLKSYPLIVGSNKIPYEGTATAPSIIQITNTGTTNIENIKIKITRRT